MKVSGSEKRPVLTLDQRDKVMCGRAHRFDEQATQQCNVEMRQVVDVERESGCLLDLQQAEGSGFEGRPKDGQEVDN